LDVWFGDPIVSSLPASTTGTAFAVGHFDSDSYFDCAVGANQGAGRSLLIYHGDGTGAMTFGAQIACPLSQVGWKDLVAGDFNGDGRVDLAGSREPTGIYYQDADGFGASPASVHLNGVAAMYERLAAADFDSDGFDDLVGFQPRYYYPKSRVYIYWGGSSGLASDPVVLQAKLYPENPNCEPGGSVTWLYEPRARDVNGDGKLDITINAVYWDEDEFCDDRKGIGWFENLGQRAFAPSASWALVWEPAFPWGIEYYDVGAINGDEYPDIVWSDSDTFESYTYFGDVEQNFTLFGLVEPGFSSSPALFDADLDGLLDLRANDSVTKILRGVGDGTFEPVTPLQGKVKKSHSCDVIPLGGPEVVGFGAESASIVVYPNLTGTTADVDAVERPMSSLRVTPSMSSAGVRLEFFGVLEGLGGSGPLSVSIVGADGSRVRELSMARTTAGAWTAEWDGRDATGRRVPAGVYFARADGVELAARFTIVR